MRIIVWGINYWPEVTGIAPFNRGMCRFLSARGHQVSMVTSFAYYPSWRKSPTDRGRILRTDVADEIPIHRCWHYVPAKATTLRRILHELSFGLLSFARTLFLPRADLYLVVSPPLILGPLAGLICWLKRSQYVFHVQDLQPDAALVLGMMRQHSLLGRVLHGMAAKSYREASLVSGISHSMLAAFAEKNVPPDKRHYLPNWVEIPVASGQSQQGGRRQTSGDDTRRANAIACSERREINGDSALAVVCDGRESSPGFGVLPEDHRQLGSSEWRSRYRIPANAFVASYSGNLGRKQGLEVLIDAAELLNDAPLHGTRPIIILIVGDGAMRPMLEARFRERPMSNARLLPLLGEAEYREMMAASDVCLITQAKGTGQFCLPSKLLSILLAGRPVAAAADESSELAWAVRQGEFGVVVPAEDPRAIATVLTELATQPEELDRCGWRGAQWVRRFEAGAVLGKLEQRLNDLVRGRRVSVRVASN